MTGRWEHTVKGRNEQGRTRRGLTSCSCSEHRVRVTIASIDAAVEQLVSPYYTGLKARGTRAAFHRFQSDDDDGGELIHTAVTRPIIPCAHYANSSQSQRYSDTASIHFVHHSGTHARTGQMMDECRHTEDFLQLFDDELSEFS